jgi:hypothetical protein
VPHGLGLEGAQVVPPQPLGRWVAVRKLHSSQTRKEGEKVATEKQ